MTRCRVRLGAAVLAAASVLSGCVTPADDPETYAAKSELTAEDAVSEIRTATVAARAWLDDELPGSYLEVVVVDAESALGAVAMTFESLQPPEDAASDRRRAVLGKHLDDAGDALATLRIASRRGQPREVAATVETLSDLAAELESLAERVG